MSNQTTSKELIFIYNAKSGLVNELIDFAHKIISHPKLLAINDCVLLKSLLAVSRLTSVIPTKDETRNREIKNLL